jgi:hypothetical protein
MTSDTWFDRIRSLDVRILAAIVATVLLVGGVMWVVPTTPNSQSFTFDSARRGIPNALPLELGKTMQGAIVDGSDQDFYRIEPLKSAYRLDVLMTTGSDKMIPALRVFDAAQNLIQDKTAEFLRRPGANINSSFLAQSNVTYYIQVFTQRNTTGPYSLTVSVRQP